MSVLCIESKGPVPDLSRESASGITVRLSQTIEAADSQFLSFSDIKVGGAAISGHIGFDVIDFFLRPLISLAVMF